MYNIPTSANDNYVLKKQNKILPIIIICVTIILITIAPSYIKVFKTHGHSMQPTIKNDSIVICIKTNSIKKGDIIAFNNGTGNAIKRVIAFEHDTIDITEEGQVYVNSQLVNENYLNSTIYGDSEIAFPHTVSHNSVFVLGDNRGNSLDSRHHPVGDVSLNDVICEVKFII